MVGGLPDPQLLSARGKSVSLADNWCAWGQRKVIPRGLSYKIGFYPRRAFGFCIGRLFAVV